MVDVPVLTTGEGEIAPRGSYRAEAGKAAQDKSAKHVVAHCDQSERITLSGGEEIWQWNVG
jgi:hypothetical protein